MTPEEEAYEEALRRIREAEKTGALELDLSGLTALIRLPRELEASPRFNQSSSGAAISDLTSSETFPRWTLQSIVLSRCRWLSDLSPLTSLTSLQSLALSGCELSGDLSPLAGLTSLQSLNLSYCGFRRFTPIASLLPMLKELYLFDCKFDDLPFEVCGKLLGNVLNKVRAHYEDLKSGQRIDAEVKVLFLGNGGAGKTQLCRRLRDLPFDPSIPTTHGIHLGQTTMELDGFAQPVRLNLWDFGGQDIYHGSHALFLQGQAAFLLLWTPELEQGETYQESGLTLRHRPLSYWLDYLRTFAGTDASMLIVQSQCDTRDKRLSHPPAKVDDFSSSRLAAVSAKTDLGLNLLKASIQEAVGDCSHRRQPPPIGLGRVAVRDRKCCNFAGVLVIGWPDAPPALFGLRSVQVAPI